VVNLEEIQRLLDFEGRIILVEGQRALSYDELVALVASDEHKNKKYLEVVVLPTIVGGCLASKEETIGKGQRPGFEIAGRKSDKSGGQRQVL
jgi:hypothetical protein